jgi:hypothetical protein
MSINPGTWRSQLQSNDEMRGILVRAYLSHINTHLEAYPCRKYQLNTTSVKL